MWQRASPAVRWGLGVFAAALLLAALNAWWLKTYRSGYPFDIDEAGYTAFGFADYLGFKYGGLDGWWNVIQGQGTFAPLIPAMTSVVMKVKSGAPSVMAGFAVLTGFSVILAMAAYGNAQRLAGPRLGALAALVTATLPGAFIYSREYIYALPTAALLAVAVYALLRSDGMRRSRWSIACGVAIGLMLLARTMAITYLPGILLAAVVVLLARRRADLGRRLINLGLLVLAAVAVAATWYAANLQSVIDYLTDYGYGAQSQAYGDSNSLFSWGRVRTVAERMVSEDLFLLLAVLLLVAVIALGVVVVRRLWPPEGRRTELVRLAGTDALSVAIVFFVGCAGLMSSQNGGNGFTFPLAALLPALAVLSLRRFPRALRPVLALLALVVAINVISSTTIWATASHTRQVSLPGFAEPFPVTKGVPKAVFIVRRQVRGPETVFDAHDSRWLVADMRIATALANLVSQDGEVPSIAFASRSRILNTNTVQVASLIKYERALPFGQLLAEPTDSVAGYTEQLTDPDFGLPPTVLVTMSSNARDFEPPVTQSYAVAAARKLGFHKVRTIRLPDGRSLYIWEKAVLS